MPPVETTHHSGETQTPALNISDAISVNWLKTGLVYMYEYFKSGVDESLCGGKRFSQFVMDTIGVSADDLSNFCDNNSLLGKEFLDDEYMARDIDSHHNKLQIREICKRYSSWLDERARLF